MLYLRNVLSHFSDRSSLTLLLVLYLTAAYSQTPAWNWAGSAGGNQPDAGSQVLCDTSGNVYSWGTFGSSTIQFGATTLVNSGSGVYLVKHDAQGNTLWAKSFPVELSSILCGGMDAQGNLYLSGEFYGTLTLGGQSISLSGVNVRTYLVKYSPAGNVIWLKKKGRDNSQALTNVTVIKKWNDASLVVIGSSVNDSLDGYSVPGYVQWNSERWLAKMDTAGNFSTFRVLGSATPYGVAVDRQLNTYISGDYTPGGSFNSAVWQLDTAVSGGGYSQAFIARFDASLNFAWSKMTYAANNGTPGSGFLSYKGLAIDPQDNLFQLGTFQADSLSFDSIHGHNLATAWNAASPSGDFLMKYTPAGTILWDSVFQRNNVAALAPSHALCTDKTGNVYFAGNFNGPGRAFNGLTVLPTGLSTIFIVKFAPDGRAVWLQKNDLAGRCFFNSMAEDGKGNLYLTGNFMMGNSAFGSNTLILSPPVQGNPFASDIFIARLGNCNAGAPLLSPASQQHLCNGAALALSASPASHYNWSTGDTTSAITVNVAGTYFVYGSDSLGCYASSAPLQVTTGSVSSGLSVSGNVLSATAAGAAYQWVDCGNAYLPVATATAQSFNPLQSGSYALVITQNNCVDTSACTPVTVIALPVFGLKKESIPLRIFPNPTTGDVAIEAQEDLQLVITDAVGRVVLEERARAGQPLLLSLSGAARGIYFIKATAADGIGQNAKIVKQ